MAGTGTGGGRGRCLLSKLRFHGGGVQRWAVRRVQGGDGMDYAMDRRAAQLTGPGQAGPQQCSGPSAFWVSGRSPGDMSALSARLSRLAGAIDNARARLSSATALEWASTAGDAFRQEVALRLADLAAGSSDVRMASDYVAAYARALDELAAKGPGLLGG